MTKYNIIGDIHGRTCWKELVTDGINIFVGDYFSPYHSEITWEQQRDNFLNIIQFKIDHMETILLVGNHDEDHWHWGHGGCSRHNYEHEEEIRQLFEKYKDYFQAAYSIDNKVLVTHAGVSLKWFLYQWFHKQSDAVINGIYRLYSLDQNDYKSVEDGVRDVLQKQQHDHEIIGNVGTRKFCEERGNMAEYGNDLYFYDGSSWNRAAFNPNDVAEMVNEVWINNPKMFEFSTFAPSWDCYGEYDMHGPMWIRYQGLESLHIFRGLEYIQVYGHTLSDDILEYSDCEWSNDQDKWIENNRTGRMYMVDCLESKTQSLIITIDNSELLISKNIKS